MPPQLRSGPRWSGWAIATAVVLVLIFANGCWLLRSSRDDEERRKKADLHYRLGDGHYQDRKIPEALRELLKAVEADPDHARAHHLLGFLYLGRHEYEKAQVHFARAVAVDPNFYEARNNLGICHLSLCQWDEAVKIFRKLVTEQQYRTPHIAHNNLGLALLSKGLARQARGHFERAVFLEPRFCVAYNNLGRTYLEERLLEDAELYLRKALKADASCADRYAEPHLHLGRVYERQGDAAGAVKEYARCAELSGDNVALSGSCGVTPVGLRCRRKLRELQRPRRRSEGPTEAPRPPARAAEAHQAIQPSRPERLGASHGARLTSEGDLDGSPRAMRSGC